MLAGSIAACWGPGGCCGSAEQANYDSAYNDALHHELVAFTYKRPLAEAWPIIISAISEFGYTINDKDPVEGRTVYSQRKKAALGGEYRVLLHVIRVDASSWRLTVEKQYCSIEDGGETLSIESHKADEEIDRMAWTIAQRVEPARTGEIEKRAREKAERAGAVGRGCDRGCAACGSMVPR